MKKIRYTLIELLISMGIFAVMMLLLLNFFSKYQDFTFRAGLRNDLLADANTFFAIIERDLKGVYINEDLDSQGISTPASTVAVKNSGSSLSFASSSFYSSLAGSDTDTGRIAGNSGIGGLTSITYDLTGTKITRKWKNAIPLDRDTVALLPSNEVTDNVISGVKTLTFTFYKTKTDFTAGTASGVSPFTKIYAILITVTLQDNNTNITDDAVLQKNRITATKLIILDK